MLDGVSISKLNNQISMLQVEHVDVRLEEIQTEALAFRNKTLENMTFSYDVGGAVRVLNNNNQAFCSFNNMSEIGNVLKVAKEITAKLDSRNNINIPKNVDVYCEQDKKKNAKDFFKIKDVLEKYYKELMMNPVVKNGFVLYVNSYTKKTFINSIGSKIIQNFQDGGVHLNITNNNNENFDISIKDPKIYLNINRLKEQGRILLERASRKVVDSVQPDNYTVLLDPIIAGVFIHETFGHICEADNLLANMRLQKFFKINDKILDNQLTIIDDPTIPGFRGSYRYDDEGCRSQRTVILDKGILRNYLHSFNTSHIFKHKPTGNARSVYYTYPPIVRMSNFVVESQPNQVEETIKNIKKGIYACGVQSGQTRLNTFSFLPKDMYLIEDGQITTPIKPTYISGDFFETIKSITVHDDFMWNMNGVCHKGLQKSLPIVIGCPSIKLENIFLGGE